MQLWGDKTVSMFDIWSFEHVLAGIAFTGTVCFILKLFKKPARQFADVNTLMPILMLCFLWEMLEHYLETGLFGKNVEFWFHGVEHWSNRLLGDSLAVLIGAYLYFKWPKILWPLKAVSIAWLTVHILWFPHSMYLQQFL